MSEERGVRRGVHVSSPPSNLDVAVLAWALAAVMAVIKPRGEGKITAEPLQFSTPWLRTDPVTSPNGLSSHIIFALLLHFSLCFVPHMRAA